MMISSQLSCLCVLVLLPYNFFAVDALNYVGVDSDNGMFKLQWAHDKGKLVFNMTCKTTGWCGVGFTESSEGRRMENYDMAVGGVASNTPYLDGYQSTGPGTPTKDPTPDYKLIKASEENGYTNIQFERIDTTEGDSKDVQFTSNSRVWIVRAWHSNDAHLGLNASLKHSHTGVSTKKYNLIMEAESTTAKNTASGMGLRVATFVILAQIVGFCSILI